MQDQVQDVSARYRLRRSLYADDIGGFLAQGSAAILGELAGATGFEVGVEQRGAWVVQIKLLQDALQGFKDRGRIYFEYAIPRLGKWVDVVLLLDHVVIVIEFKVGEARINRTDIDQVWDYALDLRNFHETSHAAPICPLLVATDAAPSVIGVCSCAQDRLMTLPVGIGGGQIRAALQQVLGFLQGPSLDPAAWERGRYQPTPTIIEAARALYAGHSVEAISRSGAGNENLSQTSGVID